MMQNCFSFQHTLVKLYHENKKTHTHGDLTEFLKKIFYCILSAELIAFDNTFTCKSFPCPMFYSTLPCCELSKAARQSYGGCVYHRGYEMCSPAVKRLKPADKY